jgi:hypothetical protein
MFGLSKRIDKLHDDIIDLQKENRILEKKVAKLERETKISFKPSGYVSDYVLDSLSNASLKEIVMKLADHCRLELKYEPGAAGYLAVEKKPKPKLCRWY